VPKKSASFDRNSSHKRLDKDLMNTLYDADHFRIALGQVSTAKHLIETVSRDYVRLIKYAQSLFQCKQLKRAGLGRMATICRRLKDPLVYLEQVRQHLGRLPSIDPNTRTLLICGYPNVGKSSFLRSITRADVDVQPYAFTTKSLFVGHFDYKYLRFQAIDTPGILDHPLEEMNTIEMQSITAIAHLRSAVMYFMDLSEQCGYSVSDQIKLFHSIRPLFANKLVFIVVNKIDVRRPEDLEPELQEEMQKMLKTGDVEMLQLSCTTTEGVTDVKNAACDKLLAERVAQKLKSGSNNAGTPGGRLGDVLARIHVAQPMGGVQRETFIPDAVKGLQKYDKNDPNRKRLERDLEEENGGAGVYNIDLKKTYTLADDDWKHDKIPEVWNGKNIYDYVDPDIEAKLAALEEEEEKLEADGYYESDESVEDAEDADTRMKADLIREKRTLMRNEAKLRKSLKNRAAIPRSAKAKKLSQMEHALDAAGYDGDAAVARARSQSQVRGRTSTRSEIDTGDAMDVDQNDPKLAIARAKVRARSQAATDRLHDGVTSETARSKAERLTKLGQKKMNRMARQGEADRHQTVSLTKHLVRCFPHPLHQPLSDITNKPLGRRKTWHGQDATSLNQSPCVHPPTTCVAFLSRFAPFTKQLRGSSLSSTLIPYPSSVVQSFILVMIMGVSSSKNSTGVGEGFFLFFFFFFFFFFSFYDILHV
jgi:nucleolar GTP-binding protein